MARPGCLRGLQHALELLVGECGITGATITPTGMPAAASARELQPRCGAGARGSSLRARSRSSVLIEM